MTYRQRIYLTIGLTVTFLLGVGVGVTGQVEHAKEQQARAQEISAWGHIRHISLAKTEDDGTLTKALYSMTEWCGKVGLPAEVWVERNAVGDLEVLGRCTRTFRSEGP